MTDKIQNLLFSLQDREYKAFQCKLMPAIDPNTVIGVRTPQLRAIAKQFANDENIHIFLNALPHKYYEENNLHAFLLEQIKDFDLCVRSVDKFLPYVNNWATCDSMKPKAFAKGAERLLPYIEKWLHSKHTYAVRYAILMLMTHFLDDNFDVKYLELVSAVKSDEYYINMMMAWYFATALAKQYDSVLPLIKQKRLPVFVHNKTIQKAVESYRISDTQKQYLKTLKRKNVL